MRPRYPRSLTPNLYDTSIFHHTVNRTRGSLMLGLPPEHTGPWVRPTRGDGPRIMG